MFDIRSSLPLSRVSLPDWPRCSQFMRSATSAELQRIRIAGHRLVGQSTSLFRITLTDRRDSSQALLEVSIPIVLLSLQ